MPLAKVAARAIVGATFDDLRAEGLLSPPAEGGHVSVKEAVLPFNRFPEVDTVLGPEMRSTGEVMGIDRTFGMAFAKSQSGAGNTLPRQGTVFLSLADRDKDNGLVAARRFVELGFAIAATAGTADMLERAGLPVDTVVAKVGEQVGVDAVDLISSGKVDLVVNTPRGRGPRTDGMHIRRAAIAHGVACVTTVAAALAASAGIAEEAAARARGALAAGISPRWSAEARPVKRRPIRRRRTGPVDLRVDLGPLRLANPVVAASGTFGHGAEVAALCDPRGLGAVTVKSVAAFPWSGNPPLRVTEASGGGMLNSVGLPGPGIDKWIEGDLPALEASGAAVIASIWGRSRGGVRGGGASAEGGRTPAPRDRGQPVVPQRRSARQHLRTFRGGDTQSDASGR